MARQTEWWVLDLPGDPVPQDMSALGSVASAYRRFAEEAGGSASGSAALIADPAIQGWMGASGRAFQSASEPFPDMLNLAKTAYEEAGDAYATLATRLSGVQAGLDRLCSQALQNFAEAQDYSKMGEGVVRIAIQQPNPNSAVERLSATLSLGGSLPMVRTAISGIYACRATAASFVAEKQQACAEFVSRLQDATTLAARIVRGSGGSGTSSLNFATRFAAYGGNVADLKLGDGAAADIVGADSALNDDASVPTVPGNADGNAVAMWWSSLTPEQRQLLIDQHPDLIGSLNGVPCDVRDQANRELLDQRIAQLEADGSDNSQLEVLTGLRNKMNEAGQSVYMTDNHANWTPPPGKFNAPMPPLYLLHFDTDGNGHLIMAAGNPDTAQNVVTYVPGLGTNMSDHMVANDIPHTENLYLQAMQNHPDASVSSIFWLGYDAPQLGGGNDGFTHGLDVAGNGSANAGAPKLTAFLNALHATSTLPAGSVHYTALGHSYGSLVVGTAAAAPGGIPVQDIIFVGSPGVGVANAASLGLSPEHVWAGSAANDPVPQLQTTADHLLTIPFAPSGSILASTRDTVDQWLNGAGIGNNGGWFGMNPATSDFHGRVFPVAPGDTGGTPPGMNAHGEYFDPQARPGNGLSSGASLENMANIVVGDYGNVRLIPYTPAPHHDIVAPGPPRTVTNPGSPPPGWV